ncbi:MAG TPA: hypothetical protein VGK25_04410 [Ignavibacteria bacterium]|jgi:hypothetical protein
MNRFKFIFGIFALIFVLGFSSNLKAQNGPVLYFCESYESSGERGIGDRFYTGPFTVMVKCDYELGLRDVQIQVDKYNGYGFDYFKAVKFDVKPSMKYIYFTDADLRVDSPGIYRVFLLDDSRKNIASGLVEFIR